MEAEKTKDNIENRIEDRFEALAEIKEDFESLLALAEKLSQSAKLVEICKYILSFKDFYNEEKTPWECVELGNMILLKADELCAEANRLHDLLFGVGFVTEPILKSVFVYLTNFTARSFNVEDSEEALKIEKQSEFIKNLPCLERWSKEIRNNYHYSIFNNERRYF